MNELLFLLHVTVVGLAALIALRFGKEGLTALFCIQALLANVFVLKQIACFGLIVTCTDTFIIGCDFSLGLLQRHYSVSSAKKAVYVCLGLLLFFVVLSQLHLLYTPCSFDSYHSVYSTLFQTTPRIICASLIVGFLSQKLNIYLQSATQNLFKNSKAALILFIPIALSQLFDTVAFSILGLYGQVHSITDIILMSYGIKLLTLTLMSPFGQLSQKFHPVSSS
jgi:uncharacterized integral membrane protein (TIGR00697 family)